MTEQNNLTLLHSLIDSAKECELWGDYNQWLGTFGEEFNNGCYPAFGEDAHKTYTEKVKAVVLREWLCTDTTVGFYAHLWRETGELLCISYQTARKSDINFTYKDKASKQKLEGLVKSLFVEDERYEVLSEEVAKDFVDSLIALQDDKYTQQCAKGVTIPFDPQRPRKHTFELEASNGEILYKCSKCGRITTFDEYDVAEKEYCK